MAFDEKNWMGLLRQGLVVGYLTKDIESYGNGKINEKGLGFIQKASSFLMSEDHEYKESAGRKG